MKHFHFPSALEIMLMAWQWQIDGIIQSPTFDFARGGDQAFSGAGLL